MRLLHGVDLAERDARFVVVETLRRAVVLRGELPTHLTPGEHSHSLTRDHSHSLTGDHSHSLTHSLSD